MLRRKLSLAPSVDRNHFALGLYAEFGRGPPDFIGDQQPDAKEKYTFTVYGAYKAGSPLVESGLLGPVKLLRQSGTPAKSSSSGK